MSTATEPPLVVESVANKAAISGMKRSRGAVQSPATLRIPEAVLCEMLAFFSLQDLLVLEDVDEMWRDAITTRGLWKEIVMRHEQDADEMSRVVESIATRHGHEVQRLEMINCAISNSVLVEYGRFFSSLKQLVVSGCKALQDAGFAGIVQASYSSIIEVRAVRCPMLTDATLGIANKHHSNTLEKVDFSHCRFITSAGVAELVQNAGCIQQIGLKGCPKVNDSAVAAITRHCPKLRSVILGGSGNISDTSLHLLADNCPHLEKLDVARSNPFGMSRAGVSDEGLAYLVSKCEHIQQLVLRGQGKLSSASLALLPTRCPRLHALDIGGCRGIVQDPVALCALLRRMSGLEQLSVSFCGGIVEDQHVSSIASECLKLKKFDVDGEAIVAAPPGPL